MGIRIDGQADQISAADGSLTVEGQSVNTTGVITATSGFQCGTAATIYSNGNATFSGIITAASHLYADQGHFTDHVYIADKIVHTGDINTAIRFPAADAITAETAGSERLRIDASGNIGIGTDTPTNPATSANSSVTSAGIVTAYKYYGDGSALTGISAGTSLSGSTDDTVCTVTGSNAIQGETNLKFDGTSLRIGGQTAGSHSSFSNIFLGGTGHLYAETTGAAGNSFSISQNAHVDTDGSWEYIVTDEASNFYQYSGGMGFRTAPSGTAGNDITWTERLAIAVGGDVTVGDGNLVIGTSGHGIDFSTGAGSDATSNLLDEYEEGTFTSTLKYNNTSDCGFSVSPAGGTDLFYTKIGRQVHVHGYIKGWTMTTGDGSNATLTLPFACTGGRNQAPGSVAHYTCFNHGTVRCIAEVSTNRLDFFQDNSTSRTTWSSGSSNYLMVGLTYHTDT